MNLPKLNFTTNIFNRMDWALILAAATEIPRWAIAFKAFNEPLAVGVPLGALLAWAMKEGWESYFSTRNKLVLGFNLWMFVTATYIISPVLYTMITHEMNEVTLEGFRITQVDPFLMSVSTALATATFLPLIVISAVRSMRPKVVNNTPAKVEKSSTAIVPAKPKKSVVKKQTQDEGDFYVQPGEDAKETVRRWMEQGQPITATKLAALVGLSSPSISRIKKEIEG